MEMNQEEVGFRQQWIQQNTGPDGNVPVRDWGNNITRNSTGTRNDNDTVNGNIMYLEEIYREADNVV